MPTALDNGRRSPKKLSAPWSLDHSGGSPKKDGRRLSHAGRRIRATGGREADRRAQRRSREFLRLQAYAPRLLIVNRRRRISAHRLSPLRAVVARLLGRNP
jgi:hypothetical protein